MDSTNKRKQSNNYLKYSGLAFQLLAGIALAGWLGYKLDQYLKFQFPVFMLSFGFLVFGGMMYQLYRTINKS